MGGQMYQFLKIGDQNCAKKYGDQNCSIFKIRGAEIARKKIG
jgi:hypothetical protein